MESFFAGLAERWPAGRADYHWHILPGPPGTAALLAAQYQELTGRPGLEAVPARWLHITVHHGPPVTAITATQAAQMTARVAEACAGTAPFAVTAGRAEAWHAGIVCPIRPGQPLRRLHQLTAAATAQITGTTPPDPAAYYPHLTIGYATARVDHRPLRAWLTDSHPAEIALPVTALALVAQHHDNRAITWQHISHVPLTGTTPGTGPAALADAGPPERAVP
jgi:2'-5' RNA ligase